MKKTTSKTKSAATKKTVANPAPKATVTAKKKRATTAKPTSAKAKSTAAGKTSPIGKATLIVAQTNIGFGNTLFLRGEGPGLSWDKGAALECHADDQWGISIKATKTVVFKFVLNDETWCAGDDLTVEPGQTAKHTPLF